jgi:hypothetical protein
VNTISALPVGNCEPLKIKCVDRSVRPSEAKQNVFPGPVIVASFGANGLRYGTGQVPSSRESISSKKTLATFFTNAYTPAKLVKEEGFQALFATDAQKRAICAKFPMWKKEFTVNGEEIAKPLIVEPPYVTDQMATFVLTPPYCNFPYKQGY